jgi:hypothetical protein
MDGVPCKEAGPKYKRRFEADRDTALEIYNRLRRNLMERADRYETAPEWQRDKLKPFDRQQYDAWLPMAQEMKKRYETGKITAEEFLDAIDIFQEEQHDAKRQTLPDARRTPLYQRIIENIDFDPAREYCDRAVLHLDLEDDHPEWKIQTSEQLQLRARGGYESLHARYGVEDPVEPLRDTDFPKTIGDMEDSEIEKLLILRQAVQDYLKSWNEY